MICLWCKINGFSLNNKIYCKNCKNFNENSHEYFSRKMEDIKLNSSKFILIDECGIPVCYLPKTKRKYFSLKEEKKIRELQDRYNYNQKRLWWYI